MIIPVSIRPAILADADAIARLHVLVWRDTYRTAAPADAYETLDEPRRRAGWRATLAAPAEDVTVLVALLGGELAGFGMCGHSTQPAFGGRSEIKNLYVATAQKRQGIGRQLMAAMAAQLATEGAHGVGLGVVVGNDAALAFYQSLGGRISGTYTDPGPLWRSENHLVIWDDIPALVAATSSR